MLRFKIVLRFNLNYMDTKNVTCLKKCHSDFFLSVMDEEKAVVRLKRYIALCGVRRNYKKLLDGCRSTRSKVAVLKKELEDLGVHLDPPSSYQRTLNSDSDSDQENDAHKGRRKMSEWANLHGIISDDADTD
ncbi:hypothetical protein XENOCAPTIV_020519 [Xenoophorus captivus]|uniref:Uncharacterized protein n=1 Tax=Xenoophorus captivus TaxID=1517983 RepID=A0ABV0RUQ5_9TELE